MLTTTFKHQTKLTLQQKGDKISLIKESVGSYYDDEETELGFFTEIKGKLTFVLTSDLPIRQNVCDEVKDAEL
jgi:hypothetical protein